MSTMKGRERVVEVAVCGCKRRWRRWRFADGAFAYEPIATCICGAALVWVPRVKQAKARQALMKLCDVCKVEFEDKSPGKNGKVCGADCRKEMLRRYARDFWRKVRGTDPSRFGRKGRPAGRRPDGSSPRAEVVHEDFAAKFEAIAQRQERAERPGTDLNTEACEAAARSNPCNKTCPKCRRGFCDTSKKCDMEFCGGKQCRRGEEERDRGQVWGMGMSLNHGLRRGNGDE